MTGLPGPGGGKGDAGAGSAGQNAAGPESAGHGGAGSDSVGSGGAGPGSAGPAATRGRAGRALGRLLALALGLGLAGWLLREIGSAQGVDFVEAHVRDHGAAGQVFFVLAGAAAAAVGAPRQAVAFLGGTAFGALTGGALSLLAQVLGCALCFGWARLVGRDWAARRLTGRFGRRLRPLHDALTGSPFGATVALRLLPVGNNLALNLLAGLSGIGAAPFLLGSALGYVPQTAVFALLGEGVAVDRTAQLALGAGLFAVSAALGWWLLRRHRAGRAIEE
ncbi:TVP38/TMEM64 family protein [Roseomonas sp. BN140053]|uniref:TVP38/TMEM64 family protein n=1 Tax=Roseomonas sp. BN140053 TaxID=3391898 RepID=UPI0039ECA4BD